MFLVLPCSRITPNIYSNIVPFLFPSGPSWNIKPLTSMNPRAFPGREASEPRCSENFSGHLACHICTIYTNSWKLHTWHIELFDTCFFLWKQLLREHSFDGFVISARHQELYDIVSRQYQDFFVACLKLEMILLESFLESKEGLRLVGARWANGSILQGGSYETWLLFN